MFLTIGPMPGPVFTEKYVDSPPESMVYQQEVWTPPHSLSELPIERLESYGES